MSRDIVMKNMCNKIQLINLMCEANTPRTLRMMGPDTFIYKHEEADITIIRYLFACSSKNKNVNLSGG